MGGSESLRRSPARRAAVMLAVVLALAPTACTQAGSATSAGSGTDAGSGASANGGAAGAAGAAAVPAAAGAGPVAGPAVDVTAATRSRIRTATLTIEASDVSRAAASAVSRVRAVGGFVGSENLSAPRTEQGAESIRSATLVLQVPPAKLDEVLSNLAGLGKVVASQRTETDVTATVADLDARLATARASLTRLRALFSTVKDLKGITALEQALTTRESELESLQARRRTISARVDTAAVTLILQAPRPAAPVAAGIGFTRGLSAGWSALRGTGRVLAAVTGALVPFLPVAAAALIGVLIWRRRRHRAS